jgi:hypothetical protein
VTNKERLAYEAKEHELVQTRETLRALAAEMDLHTQALTEIADAIIASFPFGGFACVQLSTVEQLKNIARVRLGRPPESTDPVPTVEENRGTP